MSKKKNREILDLFRIAPGSKVKLEDHDPAWAGTKDMRSLGKEGLKTKAKAYLEENLKRLTEAQNKLYASDTHSILLVLQGMDASGKDGIIEHVMSGVNPQGCQVHSFKSPSAEELDHSFLWRCMKAVPERGKICIFNRSHYEEVLVVKVHPEYLERQKLPPGKRDKDFWEARYDDINHFERHLVRNGTVIIKCFLHTSKAEQKRRFLERLENPEKHWKFSSADLAERQHWDAYSKAFEDAIEATSTKWAPWYIIPSDHKWVARTLVAAILTSTILALGADYPKVSKAQRRDLAAARRSLLAE